MMASSVFMRAEADVRGAVSSREIVPSAPRMSPTCAESSAAPRLGVIRLGLVVVMTSAPFPPGAPGGVGGDAGRERVPGTGRMYGEQGRFRPGLSCSTTRLPPAWCRSDRHDAAALRHPARRRARPKIFRQAPLSLELWHSTA